MPLAPTRALDPFNKNPRNYPLGYTPPTPAAFQYRRPDGTSTYLRPGGVFTYRRP